MEVFLKIEEIKNHLKLCDGVMIGRSIYQNPYSLIEIEKEIFNTQEVPTREQVARKTFRVFRKRS